jgi:hypothetical protein
MVIAKCKGCGSTDVIQYTAYWHDGKPFQVISCLWHTPLDIVNLGEFTWLKDISQQTA